MYGIFLDWPLSFYRWQKIFRSRLLNAFRSYANLYFNVFIVILVILFVGEYSDRTLMFFFLNIPGGMHIEKYGLHLSSTCIYYLWYCYCGWISIRFIHCFLSADEMGNQGDGFSPENLMHMHVMLYMREHSFVSPLSLLLTACTHLNSSAEGAITST